MNIQLRQYPVPVIMEKLQEISQLYIFNKPGERRKATVEIDGFEVRALSNKLRTFLASGIQCVNCKVKATHFSIVLPTTADSIHLALYAGDTLLTCDHIIPKSKGGSGRLVNLQTMCAPCNTKKGSKVPEIFQMKKAS